jgi:hypothetical protein
MGTGGHRPGEVYAVKCTSNDGTRVTFEGTEVMVTYIFSSPAKAEYYKVGTDYVLVSVATGSDLAGQENPEPQPSN